MGLLEKLMLEPSGLESRSTARNITPSVAPSTAAWIRLQNMFRLISRHSWRAVRRIRREAGRWSRNGSRAWWYRRRNRRRGEVKCAGNGWKSAISLVTVQYL